MDNNAQVISRLYQGDEDFKRVRQLLVETYSNTPVGFNWEVRRWDGWRYYDKESEWDSARNKTVHLWENDKGRLVGVVHQEGAGFIHIQIDPDYRFIEESMITWAEMNLAVVNKNKRRQISFFVHGDDSYRGKLLEKLGYQNTGENDLTRRLRFKDVDIPSPNIADGYTMRTIHPDAIDDSRRIAELLNKAFNRNFHTAEEYYNFARYAPCYREGLDRAAVTLDGSFAAYVGVPYNDNNNYGVIEPVCTHPEHQREGLARSLILAALHQLKRVGATEVLVGTGEGMAANRLYESIGFAEVCKSSRWGKYF